MICMRITISRSLESLRTGLHREVSPNRSSSANNTTERLKMKSGIPVIAFVLLLASLVACGDSNKETAGSEFQQRAIEAETNANEWLLHGRSYSGQRHSLLEQITVENINRLGLAWFIDLPSDGGLQATPLMVDGVLYFSSAWSRVYAADAKTGELLWSFDPKVDRSIEVCCGPSNRGVAYWEGNIYVGALDGRLIALNAATGELVWSALTVDQADATNQRPPPYTITGAPLVAGGKVFIGNGGAEFGVRGYVSAYDAKTGEQVWRFYTVPGNPADGFESPAMEMAAKTWHGVWWKYGGGGTAYDALSYDPELNLFYIGVGNSGPYNPLIRTDGKGDNLFVASIVAVNADTGEYVWHYQTTPGDSWDYTATQNMILADIELDGELRKVLMQAPKNGFFYIIDRKTGEFISAEAFEKVTWAGGFDKNGRPLINDSAKYWLTNDPALVYPSAIGAHNWYPMAYSPDTELVYIPAINMPQRFIAQDKEDFSMTVRGRNTGVAYADSIAPANPAITEQVKKVFKGSLIAWDPKTQSSRWTVEYDTIGQGGVLSTAGNLVFQGLVDNQLVAYSATTGDKVWSYDTQTPVVAGGISYDIDGEQFIAVMASRGGSMGRVAGRLYDRNIVNRPRLLVFKLGATGELPIPQDTILQLPDLEHVELDQDLVKQGAKLYGKYCSFCHGVDAYGNSINPDLRYSGFIQNQQAFDMVVLDGALASRGMVSFGDNFSKEESEALREYIIYENQESRKYGDTSRIGR